VLYQDWLTADISDIALSELRGRLNMVVQDSNLCSGTLREALDITGSRSESLPLRADVRRPSDL
jgi:hypothetical protein